MSLHSCAMYKKIDMWHNYEVTRVKILKVLKNLKKFKKFKKT